MHDNEACSSNEHDPAPHPSQQIVDTDEPPNEPSEEAGGMSDVSSVEPCLDPLDDETVQSRPSTEMEAQQAFEHHPIRVDSEGNSPRPAAFGHTIWNAAWQLQASIIGFYALSLLLATAHCIIFLYLDGRIISPGFPIAEKTTTVPQGYVTTISLLLTTAFRASLVASVGVCYTQYLWATMRTRTLKAALIEDLFQIQTNAFHLKSVDLYIKTPVLAVIAVFCWLVPLATVYPPGALIVELHQISPQTQFNVSVFNAKDFMFDTAPKALSNIYCGTLRDENGTRHLMPPEYLLVGLSHYREQALNASFLKTCESTMDNQYDAQYVTRSTLMSGEIAPLSQPGGDNSSYTLSFWGPSLECRNINHTVERSVLPADILVSPDPMELDPPFWSIKWPMSPSQLGENIDGDPKLGIVDETITYREAETPEFYKYYPCLDDAQQTPLEDRVFGRINLPEAGIKVLLPVRDIACNAEIKRYSVTISSIKGKQLVSYTLQDDGQIPTWSWKFADFEGSYQQWVQFSDAMAIYSQFAANLNRSVAAVERRGLSYDGLSRRLSPHTTPTGTTVETCQLETSPATGGGSLPGRKAADLEIWPLSVFVRRLSIYPQDAENDAPIFDVDMAKELLINTTINALALNRRFDVVNGTMSRAINVYRFRNKLAFFLPYGLLIGLAVPILVLGVRVFYTHNQETSAITGGFLQLLMTTTGRTDLENMIIKSTGTMGGTQNVSDELKAAEIRFGELVDAITESVGDFAPSDWASEQASEIGELQRVRDHQGNVAVVTSGVDALEKNEASLRRAGFGLAHEVRPLRRRNVR